MSNAEMGPLPPGWDTKFDRRTGRYYFINHYTQSTSWEDPRVRYQQIGKPTSTATASATSTAATASASTVSSSAVTSSTTGATAAAAGSEATTAAASSAIREARASLAASNAIGEVSSTASASGAATAEHVPLQDFSSRSKIASSPVLGTRVGAQSIHTSTLGGGSGSGGAGTGVQASPLPLQRLQLEEYLNGGGGASGGGAAGGETSGNRGGGAGSPLSQRSSAYRRESNVLADISEDATDSAEQTLQNVAAMFPTVDENHIRDLLKKYLKSVFPTVEEYLLLDVLSNSDNNVQKAADRLVKMGYVKRDTPSAPRLHARRKEEERLAEKRTPLPKPPPIKTDKEKDELRRKMRSKYEVKFDIPERILYMALESVLYDEEQAVNLINSMIEDDLKRKKAKEAEKALREKEKKKSPKPSRKALEGDPRQTRHPSPKHEPKKSSHGKKGWSAKTDIKGDDVNTTSRGTSMQEDGSSTPSGSGAAAAKAKVVAKGPNPALRKGANDDLLLTDYVTWNGTNPDLRKGANKQCAKGPNPLLNRGTAGLAQGPNMSLRKGPQGGMAKGSIYCHLEDTQEEEVSSRGRM